MSTKAMKLLLADLGDKAAKSLRRPAEPREVMTEFCRAMSVRKGRDIRLEFRAFPPDIAVSGVRLDLGERSIIVVEARTAPEAQLVILGHELWHEEENDRGHHIPGLQAAARALGAAPTPDAVRRAVGQILGEQEVPRSAVLTVAARSESASEHEVDAETFGLLFGREVRPWMKGRYAEGPVSPATVEGRINLSLLNRGRRIL
ncbi:toxin [Streptomyces sp. GXMU-J15]|uniref:Toxin n=1 Tax=Streptomyces fuscus TaxID=3048495 RepID=A0ABT7IWF8_9ACTN|nr:MULTISPECIES: toxin [Streptomyces]MDL2076392.1 toxin [Streptomyces fuscus]